MNTDHYRINVARPALTEGVDRGRYVHLFYAVVDGIGVDQIGKARNVAQHLQSAYPYAKISITSWQVRGQEISIDQYQIKIIGNPEGIKYAGEGRIYDNRQQAEKDILDLRRGNKNAPLELLYELVRYQEVTP